ncbi:MAG: sugar ABC transporter permease [Lachnospiraceae bacterium]|nr:sugar ABC transporter permease [Lachnospiraceae bacterium]
MKRQKNKLAGLQKRKAISGYLFIMPFIIGFLVFMVQPLIQSLYMSFCDVQLGAGTFNPVWRGLFNYNYAFRVDADYTRDLTEELARMAIYSVAIMVFSFFVALVLNQKFKGRAFVRSVFFLPVILASGVMLKLDSDNALMAAVAQTVELNAQGTTGITDAIQEILRTSGVGVRAFEKLFEVIDNIYNVAISSGIQIIIFLSGLQTISNSMYEAADIEGCTKWESLWKITFPMVSSLFLVNWIYTVVDFCMRSDNKIIEKITELISVNLKYGLASAMSWAYFVLVMLIVGISSLIISKGVYYYE